MAISTRAKHVLIHPAVFDAMASNQRANKQLIALAMTCQNIARLSDIITKAVLMDVFDELLDINATVASTHEALIELTGV